MSSGLGRIVPSAGFPIGQYPACPHGPKYRRALVREPRFKPLIPGLQKQRTRVGGAL